MSISEYAKNGNFGGLREKVVLKTKEEHSNGQFGIASPAKMTDPLWRTHDPNWDNQAMERCFLEG
jgi:hypothetical protein